LNDDGAHKTALKYAQELFRENRGIDVAVYEILGAAYYANGNLALGTQFFTKLLRGVYRRSGRVVQTGKEGFGEDTQG
jgi:hypothetical protein|tara:strand:+ start:152 stop:385 length:234 start_codon:yes stop_codon:yes gene_type:complete